MTRKVDRSSPQVATERRANKTDSQRPKTVEAYLGQGIECTLGRLPNCHAAERFHVEC